MSFPAVVTKTDSAALSAPPVVGRLQPLRSKVMKLYSCEPAVGTILSVVAVPPVTLFGFACWTYVSAAVVEV